jgi:UDP-N-acetylmuramate--alanine ligase
MTAVDTGLSLEMQGLRVYMIGIGGCGMSGVAAMLRQLGATVSGSDMSPFAGMGDLVSRGIRVFIGHDVHQLQEDADIVVMSAAIPEANPELAAARRRGLRVIKYAELLGMVMAHRRGVAVAGTHGKSTTSAMCTHLFQQAGLSPSFVIGAGSAQLGGSSGVGEGPDFIVESCEYDRSFLHLHPQLAAILNIEPDHLDCYKDLDEIVEAFGRFAANIQPDGVLVCNAENSAAGLASEQACSAVETFGVEVEADWTAANLRVERGCFTFDVSYRGAHLFSTKLSLPGRYNVSNALAAAALAYHAGALPERLAEALPTFAGVSRRLSHRGEGGGVTIIDDYAHHPTEVRVTIEAARRRYEPKRMWVVFQPHQHSRTQLFMDEFAGAFGLADEIIVPNIYAARGAKAPGEMDGSEELVARICRNGGRARYLPTLEAAADHVAEHMTGGDLIVTMGAGDVWKVADELVQRIC